MSIGSRQNLSNSDYLFIIIDDEDISNIENKKKLLGIIIDKTLSWDKQIDSVCLNITRRVRVSVMFHFMFVHYTFSSVCVAEWPPFWK